MDELVKDDGLSLPRPMEYVRDEVNALARDMEMRLREKEIPRADSWKGMSPGDLWVRIPGQVEKLRAAIDFTRIIASDQDMALIRKKCADIANYCMFIHDNVGK